MCYAKMLQEISLFLWETQTRGNKRKQESTRATSELDCELCPGLFALCVNDYQKNSELFVAFGANTHIMHFLIFINCLR